jgi:hypothetical protein
MCEKEVKHGRPRPPSALELLQTEAAPERDARVAVGAAAASIAAAPG